MKDKTLALTPECTIVWPDLFEPVAFKESEELYRALLLIKKDQDLSKLKLAIQAAAYKKF